MPDRADYIARTLIARLARLQANLAEDGRAEPDRAQRIAAIEKVLAVELGLTDGATLSLIEATAPRLKSGQRAADREVAAFADFLRHRLARQLAES
jgi:hypothetical protein